MSSQVESDRLDLFDMPWLGSIAQRYLMVLQVAAASDTLSSKLTEIIQDNRHVSWVALTPEYLRPYEFTNWSHHSHVSQTSMWPVLMGIQSQMQVFLGNFVIKVYSSHNIPAASPFAPRTVGKWNQVPSICLPCCLEVWYFSWFKNKYITII